MSFSLDTLRSPLVAGLGLLGNFCISIGYRSPTAASLFRGRELTIWMDHPYIWAVLIRSSMVILPAVFYRHCSLLKSGTDSLLGDDSPVTRNDSLTHQTMLEITGISL